MGSKGNRQFSPSPFDRYSGRWIHFLLGLALAACLAGCPEKPAPADAGAELPDAGLAPADSGLAEGEPDAGAVAADGGESPLPDGPTSGVVEQAGERFLQVVERVPRGVDVSLARDRAAARARAKLLEILKKGSNPAAAAEALEGATIARIWTRGRWVYAEGVLRLADAPGIVNDSGPAPSKSPESGTPDPAPPVTEDNIP